MPSRNLSSKWTRTYRWIVQLPKKGVQIELKTINRIRENNETAYFIYKYVSNKIISDDSVSVTVIISFRVEVKLKKYAWMHAWKATYRLAFMLDTHIRLIQSTCLADYEKSGRFIREIV